MNMIKNSSGHVQNTIRIMSYCIAVVSKLLFYEIHSVCHCVYVTVCTTAVHISHVIPSNELSNMFG